MKTISYFLFCFAILVSWSCTENEESSYHETEATLSIDIPISVTGSESLKSEEETQMREIPFSGSNDYQFSEMLDPSNRFLNLRKIQPVAGSLLRIPGVIEGFEISELVLRWGYKSAVDFDFTMVESIDLLTMDFVIHNETLELNLDEIAGQIINQINNTDIVLRFNISGNCNKNLNGVANLKVPVIIESKVYSPRFELF